MKKLNESLSYSQLKEISRLNYSSIVKTFSPALNSEIFWNSKGFNHIVYKKGSAERNRADQILRFNNIGIAKELIEHTNTY